MRKILALTTGFWLLTAPLAFAQSGQADQQPSYQQLSENDRQLAQAPQAPVYPPAYYAQPSAPAAAVAQQLQEGDYGFSAVNDLRQLNF